MPQVYVMNWCDEKHLRGEWVTVYGYDMETGRFLIWDHILDQWQFVSVGDCSGKGY